MTPRISKSKCRRCSHYRDNRCTLIDLDPCIYARKEDEPHITLALIIIGVCIALIILFACSRSNPTDFGGIKSEIQDYHWSAVQLLRSQHKNELTEWDELILAISYTESRWRPDAIGKAGDSGCLQITKPYTDELNRLYGTDYTPSDAFDIDTSLAMFDAMQAAKNPERDLSRAIYFHNKSDAYKQTVLRNLEMVRNYEAIRKQLIKYGN